MAEIVEVKVNYGETVNLGNYESLRLDFGVTMSIDPTIPQDDVVPIMHKVKDQLKREMQKAIKAEMKDRR